MEKIKVIINNKQKEVKIPTGLRLIVRRCCNAVLRLEGFPHAAVVGVSFVDSQEIRELNAKFRKKDIPTDVLSFATGENGEYTVDPETNAKILGDVIISVQKASEQAKLYGHNLQREIAYLTVHGVLHLLGYDHELSSEEKVKMREKEEMIMAQLGFSGGSNYLLNQA